MSNSSQSAHANLRQHDAPGHTLRIGARDGGRSFLPDVSKQIPDPSETATKLLAATRPATGQADAIWQSVLWFFLEGFALYSLHWVATTPVTVIASEDDVRQRQKPARSERQKSSLVSARAETTILEHQDAIDRTAVGTRKPSTRDSFMPPAREVDRHRFVQPGWLAMIWRAIARRWAKSRREREIKKAVTALAEYDDRTLRDVGIPDRSQIEQILRYDRDS